MEQTAHILSASEAEYSGLGEIQTTLRDLVEAVNEEVAIGEDRMVAEVVLDMLDDGKIKFLNPRGKLALFCESL